MQVFSTTHLIKIDMQHHKDHFYYYNGFFPEMQGGFNIKKSVSNNKSYTWT